MKKSYLMELVGAFFMTLTLVTTENNPVAQGIMLIGLMYIGFHISGAHFNPAISVGVLLRKAISLEQFGIYVAMQVVGALLALAFQQYLIGQSFSPEAISAIDPSKVFFAELLLVAFFVWVYLTVTTNTRLKQTPVYATAVGLAFLGIGLVGGLFNPAIVASTWAFNLLSGVGADWHEMAVYLIAPLFGGMLAAVAYDFFNGTKKQ